MNNYAPLQGVAQNLAQHGRYGDSMLVHMNPTEVQGIAALSPNGQLTVNPVTGQPEAFLPFLLSMLANVGASTAAVSLIGPTTAAGLSSGVAGAIGSGLLTTALTGDPLQGLASGITGYGLGKIGVKAAEGANPAIKEATEKLATEESLLMDTTTGINVIGEIDTSAIDTYETMKLAKKANPASISEPAFNAANAAAEQVYAKQAELVGLRNLKDKLTGQEMPIMGESYTGNMGYGGVDTPDFASPVQIGTEKIPGRIDVAKDALQTAYREADYGPGRSLFTKEGAAAGFKQLIDPETLIPVAIGEGQRSEMEYEEEQRRLSGQTEEQRRQDYMRSEGILREAQQAYPGYPGYAAGGGIVSVNPNNYSSRRLGFEALGNDPIRMQYGGLTGYDLSGLGRAAQFGEGTSAERQFALRGQMPITPEELAAITSSPGGRAGFGPEISYFSRPPVEMPEDIETSGEVSSVSDGYTYDISNLSPEQQAQLQISLAGYGIEDIPSGNGNVEVNTEDQILEEELMEDDSLSTAYSRQFRFQEGGGITDLPPPVSGPDPMMGQGPSVPSALGPDPMAAQVPNLPVGGAMPSDNEAMNRLIDQTQMAVLGQLPPEQAEVVITQFINVFGEEAFQRLREQILQTVEPGAQTQGMIQGPGGGMDDMVQGSIGDQQRVAVSPGEFIVPADVVSGLGDGSSNAGADKLDTMMNQVRMAKTGGIMQPRRISNTVLPV